MSGWIQAAMQQNTINLFRQLLLTYVNPDFSSPTCTVVLMNSDSFSFDPNSTGGSDPFKKAINAPNIIIFSKRKKDNMILPIYNVVWHLKL